MSIPGEGLTMKILVTGHLGYVGTVLTPLLLADGHDVSGCDSDLFEGCACRAGGSLALVPNLCSDFRDLTQRDLEGFDAVVHLAALTDESFADLMPSAAFSANHLGSVQLATTAKRAGVPRFILASTCSNLGQSGAEIVNKAGELDPPTPYAKSKLWAERDISSLADEAFSPVFLRLASTFGLSPRMRFDTVLNDFTARAVMTGLISLKSDGTSWRPILHVDDAARAFIAAVMAPDSQVSGHSFNIGSGAQHYRLRDLAQIIADTVPCCRLEFAPEDGLDERSHRVSFEKAECDLPGFRAEWDARRGAEQLREVYQALGLTPDDLDGGRYDRRYHLMKLHAEGVLDDDLRLVSRSSAAAFAALAS